MILHAAQQTIAMLDGDTGEVVERTLTHDGETVREFYASIPGPAVFDLTVAWLFDDLPEDAADHLPEPPPPLPPPPPRVVEGSLTKNLNKTEVRLWTDSSVDGYSERG